MNNFEGVKESILILKVVDSTSSLLSFLFFRFFWKKIANKLKQYNCKSGTNLRTFVIGVLSFAIPYH